MTYTMSSPTSCLMQIILFIRSQAVLAPTVAQLRGCFSKDLQEYLTKVSLSFKEEEKKCHEDAGQEEKRHEDAGQEEKHHKDAGQEEKPHKDGHLSPALHFLAALLNHCGACISLDDLSLPEIPPLNVFNAAVRVLKESSSQSCRKILAPFNSWLESVGRWLRNHLIDYKSGNMTVDTVYQLHNIASDWDLQTSVLCDLDYASEIPSSENIKDLVKEVEDLSASITRWLFPKCNLKSCEGTAQRLAQECILCCRETRVCIHFIISIGRSAIIVYACMPFMHVFVWYIKIGMKSDLASFDHWFFFFKRTMC